jgi:4,5:9,10-diseco-3-hydroxy-5,9,17-trioxoandrosta-1(10),2-diene-4-oate hydrolase
LDSKYLTVHGMRVHYVEAGAGAPVFLLHGVGSSMVAWRENILPLAKHYRVIAVDLPGHGDSDKPDIPYTLPNATRFMCWLLDAFGLERAHLVGESLGGMIALRLALDHPERLDRVVAVGPAGLGRDVGWVIRWVSMPVVGEIVVHPTARRMKYLVKKFFYADRRSDIELAEEMARVRASPGAQMALLKMVRWGVTPFGLRSRAMMAPELPHLRVPTMLVWGENDAISPVEHGYKAQALNPGLRLEVYPECGHWAQMERAEHFNATVAAFLSGRPR